MGSGAPTRTTWDVEVLLNLLAEDHGPVDWRAVVEGLDFAECDLTANDVSAQSIYVRTVVHSHVTFCVITRTFTIVVESIR